MAGGVADEDDSEAREADDRSDVLPALIKRFIFGLARSPSSSGPTLVGSGSSGPITCVGRATQQRKTAVTKNNP